MHQIFLLLVCISAAWPSPITKFLGMNNQKSGRIVNGANATEGQFPWQVAIFTIDTESQGSISCGGSLISDEWVLTAAHCVMLLLKPEVQVVLGSVNLEENKDYVSIFTTNFLVHENFGLNLVGNTLDDVSDIALVKLTIRLIPNDKIAPIDLPSDDDFLDADTQVTISGFGITRDSDTYISPVLKYTELITISNEECAKFYQPGDTIQISVTEDKVCAQHRAEIVQTPCSGDSGGALVVGAVTSRPVQVGIACFVSADGCESGVPSGYVRLATYRNWIRNNTGL